MTIFSGRLLSMYKNSVDQKPGINGNSFKWMRKVAKENNLSEQGYTGYLAFDEMKIQVCSCYGQQHLSKPSVSLSII